jgi:hypothetical protein
VPERDYSGVPLPKKLGIREESRVGFGAEGWSGSLPPRCDVLLFFVTRRSELESALAGLLARMDPAGRLWICWPKKSSKMATDVTDNDLRDLILPTGWVDNKGVAIDATWTALQFVLRKELRP